MWSISEGEYTQGASPRVRVSSGSGTVLRLQGRSLSIVRVRHAQEVCDVKCKELNAVMLRPQLSKSRNRNIRGGEGKFWAGEQVEGSRAGSRC